MNLKAGCPFGTHRVINPKGTLPQSAEKIDNSMELFDNEILIDVLKLNIDAASFRQIKEATDGSEESIAKTILETIENRGKQHNPVTGSGGMLIGKVKSIGPKYSNKMNVKKGDLIASLVSLSLTPLKIKKVKKVILNTDQIEVEALAILFDSSPLAIVPNDLSENLALALFDVAGAPAQTNRLVSPGKNIIILGAGGKAASLCAAVAKTKLKGKGRLIGIEPTDFGLKRMKDLDHFDEIIKADATNPLECMEKISAATNGEMGDVVINCASVDNTEMSSILCAKLENAIVYFFTMTTQFTKAALGAEGVGSDATLIIGNGFAPGHAEFTIDLIKKEQKLKELFESYYE